MDGIADFNAPKLEPKRLRASSAGAVTASRSPSLQPLASRSRSWTGLAGRLANRINRKTLAMSV